MAVPIKTPPPPSSSEQAIRRMEAEHQMLKDEKFTGWAVIWTLFGFKLGTIALILIVGRNSADRDSGESMAYILSTTWYWFIIPLVAISGFVAWKIRLYRIRRRARHLKRSEFSSVSRNDLTPLSDDEKERLRQIQLLPENER